MPLPSYKKIFSSLRKLNGSGPNRIGVYRLRHEQFKIAKKNIIPAFIISVVIIFFISILSLFFDK